MQISDARVTARIVRTEVGETCIFIRLFTHYRVGSKSEMSEDIPTPIFVYPVLFSGSSALIAQSPAEKDLIAL